MDAANFVSRVIAEAIGKRLQEPLEPEFVVVNPRTAYGWLDQAVMSRARYELMKGLQEKDRGSGRTLILFDPEEPPEIERKIARAELLDPQAPDELLERKARPGFLSKLRSAGH